MHETHSARPGDTYLHAAIFTFCGIMSLVLLGLAGWALLNGDYGPGLIGLVGAVALAAGLLVELTASARERL